MIKKSKKVKKVKVVDKNKKEKKVKVVDKNKKVKKKSKWWFRAVTLHLDTMDIFLKCRLDKITFTPKNCVICFIGCTFIPEEMTLMR